MAYAPTDLLFEEILEFLASTPTPQQIIEYQPTETLHGLGIFLIKIARIIYPTPKDRKNRT